MIYSQKVLFYKFTSFFCVILIPEKIVIGDKAQLTQLRKNASFNRKLLD